MSEDIGDRKMVKKQSNKSAMDARENKVSEKVVGMLKKLLIYRMNAREELSWNCA